MSGPGRPKGSKDSFQRSKWRAPSLPGANAPLPPGVAPLPIKAATLKKLVTSLRFMDNAKSVETMEPYILDAESAKDAIREELESLGYGVSPTVLHTLSTLALQHFWSRYLSDKAAEKDDAKLALIACQIATAASATLLAAHKLHRDQIAEKAESITVDPLGMPDAPDYDVPVEVEPSE